ncbi:MAG: HEAT repeat domain-containing protein [Gammaproteobacteria bacterium]
MTTNPQVRSDAIKTLGNIGDRSTIPSLIERLRDPDANVRKATVGEYKV